MRADVLVIGAGPAGSAAAAVLAAGGARVVLADRAAPGRDKVCGDGLLPDAVAALAALGAEGEVRRAGQAVVALRLRGAGGGGVALPVNGVVIRRSELDALLVAGAAAAGAELLTGATLAGLERDGRTFTAARFLTATGETAVAARAFVLATGAARRPRELAELGEGEARSAVALRGYVRLAGVAAGRPARWGRPRSACCATSAAASGQRRRAAHRCSRRFQDCRSRGETWPPSATPRG